MNFNLYGFTDTECGAGTDATEAVHQSAQVNTVQRTRFGGILQQTSYQPAAGHGKINILEYIYRAENVLRG